MDEKIRIYINELFTDAPKTRRAMELKEEMTLNTIEKYQDLVGEGYREEDAFQNVIDSIGDVTELFEGLEEPNLFTLTAQERKTKAVLTAVAVGFYIFAGAVLIACMVLNDSFSRYFHVSFDFGLIGVAITAILCIPPTCMLVYTANMYPTYHKRKEESQVELYKEAAHTSNQQKAINTSISVIIWTVTLILYFLISFVSKQWQITWIIFLIGCCAQSIATLLFSIRQDK